MAASSKVAIAADILSKIKADSSGQDDWQACSSEIYLCVQECLQQLIEQLIEKRSSYSLSEGLSLILKQAEDAIKSVHHSKVQRKWRRLYTDICILKAIQVVSEPENADLRDRALVAIKDLDMAIIICGAPGLDRLEMIYQEISLLQKELPLPQPHSKKYEAVKTKQNTSAFCLASKNVTELSSLPILSEYLSHLHAEPFIVRNFASSWPAIQDENHNWADGNYLTRVGGSGRVVPVEIGWQYTESDWYQDVISWKDFLQASGWITAKDESTSTIEDKPRYLAQHNLFRQFPALESDIIVPDVVYSCPPFPQSFAQYSPPIDEDGLETAIINAWIGPKGTTTPAHFDPYYNAYVQVVGQKLVWIAPSNVFSEADNSLLDGNSSTLNIFEETAMNTKQSIRAYEMGMRAVLDPGDLLVLPPGWFHALRSLSRSFSVSMWY